MLLLCGGVLLPACLPLQWSSVATVDGRFSVSMRGVDYAGYDIVVTVALALLLAAAALAVTASRRWGGVLAAVAALLACMWAGLVCLAAARPSDGGAGTVRVSVSVGAGAYLLAAGAVVALIGALLSLRGRAAPAVAPSAQSNGA